jgi:porin
MTLETRNGAKDIRNRMLQIAFCVSTLKAFSFCFLLGWPLSVFAVEPEPRDENETYQFGVAYKAGVLSNLDGGIRRETRYLDNLDVTLAVDGAQAFGRDGLTFFLYGLYNNGTRFSEDVVGDAQVVSNIETGVQATRLYEAWIDQRFLSDRASIRFGLYDLNSEFDAINPAGLFLQSAQGIGTDFAQSGRNGPSIFPVTSLSVRGELRLTDTWVLRAAVLDGVPGDPAQPERTTVELGNGEGVLVVGEVNQQSGPLRSGLGVWGYSSRMESLAGTGDRHRSKGVYAFLSGKAYSEAADSSQGLALYGRAGQASESVNQFETYVGAGAVYTGLLPARPMDQLGLAMAWAETGSTYRIAENAEQREVALELTYRAQIHDLFALQSSIHYVINPGAVPELDNALVFGLRAELGFGLAW